MIEGEHENEQGEKSLPFMLCFMKSENSTYTRVKNSRLRDACGTAVPGAS